MAIIICPICGGENDDKNIGKACEYCGTLLVIPKVEESLDKKNTRRAMKNYQVSYGNVIKNKSEILEIVKKHVKEQLNRVEKKANKSYQWLEQEIEFCYLPYISPSDEKFDLLKFNVELFYVPCYTYKIKGAYEEDDVETYTFVINANVPSDVPPIVRDSLNYKKFDFTETKSDPLKGFKINLNKDFTGDPCKFWDSIKGRNMLKKYVTDFDGPKIGFQYFPVYYITVRCGSVKNGLVMDGNGNFISTPVRKELFEEPIYIYPEKLFLEHYLGENWESILKERLPQEWEEERVRRKTQKDKNEKKAVILSFIFVGLMAALIFGLFKILSSIF